MRRLVLAAILCGAAAAPASAQSTLLEGCAVAVPSQASVSPDVENQFRQLCAQVVNSFTELQPGIGIAFSGGNPVLGTGSTIGTRLNLVPRVTVSMRANLAYIEMPQLFRDFSASVGDGEGLVPMERVGIPLGSVQTDASVGLFNGFGLGVGSVDLLGTLSVVPKFDQIGLTESLINYGGGARIGLVSQSLAWPGVSVSGVYRRLNRIGFGDLATHSGAISSGLDNFSLRAVASKGLLLVDLAAGAGYDRYSSNVDLGWKLVCETTDCRAANGGDPLTLSNEISGKVSSSAWNVFANAGFNLAVIKFIGELGYQRKGSGIGASDLQQAGFPADQGALGETMKGGNLFGSIGIRLAI